MMDTIKQTEHVNPIKWNDALIYVSAFSYLAAAIATSVGYPLLNTEQVSSTVQIISHFIAFSLLMLCEFYPNLRFGVAGLYGMVAMYSFSGLQQWVNYYGTGSLGPSMAAWDLILAVSLIYNQKTSKFKLNIFNN